MNKEILFEGKYRKFVRKNGWEFVERHRSNQVVVLIPVTDAREVVFVEQFRIPVEKKIIEFPAGLVNDMESFKDETLEETARRELIEETGFEAGTLKKIRYAPANSAVATDMLTVYYATDLKKVGDGGGDESEQITVHVIPFAQVDAWLESQISQGKYVDLKVYAGLYYLKSKWN